MVGNHEPAAEGPDGPGGRGRQPARRFEDLTEKQHEVLRFVAENRTSKEIAWDLGISESAVNQRIESVRNRMGAPPRAELARSYRQYLRDVKSTYNSLTADFPQVGDSGAMTDARQQDGLADRLALADAVTFTFTPPWQGEQAGRIVPEVLDGANAGLSRTAAMIAIAAGLLLVAMVGLGVVNALSHLF